MNTYKWSVLSMATVDTGPNKEKLVVLVNFLIEGISNDNSLAKGYAGYNVQLDIVENIENFTPYEQLTEEEVINWIKNTLKPQEIASLLANIDGQISLIIQPPITPTIQEVPWINK